MKKIGILTFHKPINYGAFLQAFSLTGRLQKEFPDAKVEIVDYIAKRERRKIWRKILSDVKHVSVLEALRYIKRIGAFRRSYPCLPLSERSAFHDDLPFLYSYIEENYDCLVIGSDAIFNWLQNEYPTAFIMDYDLKIPVFYYAASVHGLPFYEEPQERIEQCGRTFEKSAFIGVRDQSSADFVRYCNPSAEPVHCCDPTFFIDQEKISAMVQPSQIEKKGISFDEKYIVFMIPDSQLTKQVAEKYRGKYRIISVFQRSAYADCYLYDLTPFEWAYVLKRAEAVITSFFHGTLLSLVQGTPAIVIDYSGYTADRYEGKLRDLMITRLGLPELFHEKEYAVNFSQPESFFETFEAVLEDSYHEQIKAAIERERKTFDPFLTLLQQNI